MADPELGAWLRLERKRRCWAKPEMARRLLAAARDEDDPAVPSAATLRRSIHRWERGETGISLRYRRYYSAAFGIDPAQFGPGPHGSGNGADGGQPRDMSLTAIPASPGALIPMTHPDSALLPLPPAMIYRGRQEPGTGEFAVGQEVMMAAHESSDHAAEHEPQGIGEATSEQLRADLIRLSRLTDSGPPLTAFLDLRRLRDRIYRLLDRQPRPGEQADLYLLLCCVHSLMGLNANRLGYPDGAEELIRAGWAYANVIGHNPLRGLLRVNLSYIMYWRGRFRESRDLAADGLRYAPQGPLGGNLHVNHARAAAKAGDPDTARQAVALAHAAQEDGHHDDLTEIGGEEFAFSRPTTYAMAGGALADTGGDWRGAATELEQAISLYDEAQAQGGGRHWFGGRALAGTDLALVRLRSGALDAAAAALEPVLLLPPPQRVSSLTARLARVRDELAAPAFHGSPQARDLGGQIEAFSREAIASGLHTLTG